MKQEIDIQKRLDEYHGDYPQFIYFENDNFPFFEYWLDDDKLCSECVCVPFNYNICDLDDNTIFNSIMKLQAKIIDYYKKEKNITLIPLKD